MARIPVNLATGRRIIRIATFDEIPELAAVVLCDLTSTRQGKDQATIQGMPDIVPALVRSLVKSNFVEGRIQ